MGKRLRIWLIFDTAFFPIGVPHVRFLFPNPIPVNNHDGLCPFAFLYFGSLPMYLSKSDVASSASLARTPRVNSSPVYRKETQSHVFFIKTRCITYNEDILRNETNRNCDRLKKGNLFFLYPALHHTLILMLSLKASLLEKKKNNLFYLAGGITTSHTLINSHSRSRISQTTTHPRT
jgi:hypothetical protein